MKTILATAYAMNPYKGSEDGTGWNLIEQISQFNRVIAITRKNNRQAIEQYLSDHPQCVQNRQVLFYYFDLPHWMMFWKKGERGAMLYFYLWQFFIPLFIARKKLKYDVLHNLNFHNDWTPTFLWILNKPVVWGPVGHHPKTPGEYVKRPYGMKSYVNSRVLWLVKQMFWRMDPFLRLALSRVDALITMNSGVEKVHRIHSPIIYRMPAVGACQAESSQREPSDIFIFLSVGRLVPMKGFDLTIAAFARFYATLSEEDRKKVCLKIVGKGPLLSYLKAFMAKQGIEHAVQINEWVDKDQMPHIYKESSVFLFPSHEGAGMVVPEALSYGLPVVCFDNEGPGEFIDTECGFKIPYSTYEQSVSQFAQALHDLYFNREHYRLLSEGAYKAFESKFKWDTKAEMLNKIYSRF